MSSWDGYVADIPYVSGYYPNLSPHKLNLACLIHGFKPPALGMGSAYLELGCGHGITLLVLAAANPEAQFVGIDYLGEHIRKAKRMARTAGLKNIKFLKADFGDLAKGRPRLGGPYSYIVAHGVYTWISRRKRRNLRKITERYLATDGLLFLGYNALPGWTEMLPVQRMLRALSKPGDAAGSNRMPKALLRLKEMITAGAKGLEPMQAMKNLMAESEDLNLPYLTHEYLHSGWEPMYLLDVASDMKKSGLDFIGPVHPISSLPFLKFTDSQRKIMDSVKDPLLREQMGDFFRPALLREDIFIRGGKQDKSRCKSMLSQLVLAGTGKKSLKIGAGEGTFTATLDDDIYGPMLKALERGPTTAAELLALSQSRKESIPLPEIIAVLLGTHLAVHLPQPDLNCPVSAFKLTGALLEDLIDHKLKGSALIVAPKRGEAIMVDMFELAVYMAISNNFRPGHKDFIERVWDPYRRSGQQLVEKGKIIQDPAARTELLSKKATRLLELAMPKWKAFGALPG